MVIIILDYENATNETRVAAYEGVAEYDWGQVPGEYSTIDLTFIDTTKDSKQIETSHEAEVKVLLDDGTSITVEWEEEQIETVNKSWPDENPEPEPTANNTNQNK